MATERQKLAFDKMAENGGIVSRAMEEAGYSHQTAKTPQKLTESKGWKELMEEYLPDEELGRVHQELLNKRETIIVRDGKDSHVELTDQPHSDAKSALDMAYKLKGVYAAEKRELKHSGTIAQTLAEIENGNESSNKVIGQIVEDVPIIQNTQQAERTGDIPQEQSSSSLPSEQVVEKYNPEEPPVGIHD